MARKSQFKRSLEWNAETYDLIWQLAKANAPLDEVAAKVGWTPGEVNRRLVKCGAGDYETMQQMAFAAARGELRVQLMKMAASGKHPLVTVFYAKNVLGMAEITKNLSVNVNARVDQMTSSELKQRLAYLEGATPLEDSPKQLPAPMAALPPMPKGFRPVGIKRPTGHSDKRFPRDAEYDQSGTKIYNHFQAKKVLTVDADTGDVVSDPVEPTIAETDGKAV